MGVVGFIIGTVAGQFAGAWAYWRVRGHGLEPRRREALAAVSAGLVTAFVAAVVYKLSRVNLWLDADGSPWGISAFIGACVGICQGVLFRGRPLAR